VGGTVIMPNLIGMKFEEASKVVEQAGLSLGIVRYGDMPAAAPDMVVMQSPEPGTAIGAGQPVDLTLSIAGGVIEQNVDEAAPQVEATE
ncbi:MAG: PASTA domain-containing protein, partial [candidate division KSB1 bacterium]|nr:PASTA domain-containing protein [candidate division KSB1 bacterium]